MHLFSMNDADFSDWASREVASWSEEQRVDTFELLMEMACDFLHQPGEDSARMALRAEIAASLIVPYDDHSLRGRIRFNSNFQEN
jgi:hypothetical protein